jgi:hypothetical protein
LLPEPGLCNFSTRHWTFEIEFDLDKGLWFNLFILNEQMRDYGLIGDWW